MDSTSLKSQRKERSKWSYEGEELLLVLWAQNASKLRRNGTNFYIFSKMSNKMEEMGYPFSAYEIRFKIHNLKGRYREELKRIADGYPSPWPIFDSVHRILEKYKSKNNNSIKSCDAEDLKYSQEYVTDKTNDADDNENFDEYHNGDSFDYSDETATSTHTPYKGQTEKNEQTEYLKSINDNLIILIGKINDLTAQSRDMERKRTASLNHLLDMFKHHSGQEERGNRPLKRVKLSKPNEINQDTEDPLYNESTTKSSNGGDGAKQQTHSDEEEIITDDKTDCFSPQSNKAPLEQKLREEDLKTRQFERDFMTEKHNLQRDILNAELEANRKFN